MPRKIVDTWPGGYVTEARGRRQHVIRRRVGGREYEINTRASSLRAAMAHLERFEADPQHYRPEGDPAEAPVYFSAELARAFLDWSAQSNSRDWVIDQKRYLAWWAQQLRDVDLRKLHIGRDVVPRLDGVTARQKRIAVLKRFCSWLTAERHLLERDPTGDALHVPTAAPAQATKRKDVGRLQLDRTYAHVPPHWRDPLDVQLGTGWHVRELHRFSRVGRLDQVDDVERPDVAGELIVLRKSGVEKRTPVGAYVLAAALRLRARGGLSLSRYANAIRAAAAAAGVEVWGPGQIRHTVATYARSRAGTRATSDFLDHSETTSKKFYSVFTAPPKVPTPR